jgi:hypothetical protein
MKIFKINKCQEPDCPFFKSIIDTDDENFIGLCTIDKRYITEFDQSVRNENLWVDSDILFVFGTIPDWCPLDNDYDLEVMYEINTTSIK